MRVRVDGIVHAVNLRGKVFALLGKTECGVTVWRQHLLVLDDGAERTSDETTCLECLAHETPAKRQRRGAGKGET